MLGFISCSLCLSFLIPLFTIFYFTNLFDLLWSEPIEDGDYDLDDDSQDENESHVVFVEDPVEAHEREVARYQLQKLRRAKGLDEDAMADSHVDVQNSIVDTSFADIENDPEMAPPSPQFAPQVTRRIRRQRVQFQSLPEAENAEIPAMPQSVVYTQEPSHFSPPPPYTPPTPPTKRNPILEQAGSTHYRRSLYYPQFQPQLSPTFFTQSNYTPTPTPTPQVYQPPAPVAPQPASEQPSVSSIIPELLSNIAASMPESSWMPPLPVANWSAFFENFMKSNEVQQQENIADQPQEIPDITQSHSPSTSQAQEEKSAKLDDLPPQEEQQAEPEYKPWFDLSDEDHDMDNEVMGDPEDADKMDIRLDTNVAPAPWVHMPPPCPPARPRLWADSKPRPLPTYHEQAELMRKIHLLMNLEKRFQEEYTDFARQSLISMARNLLSQILEAIKALQSQNKCTPLADPHANCLRFWTDTIANIQKQHASPPTSTTTCDNLTSYPAQSLSQPPAPTTPPQAEAAARGSTSSENSDEAGTQSPASFFDAVSGTTDRRRGSGGDALPYPAAESRGTKRTRYQKPSYTPEKREAWKVAVKAKNNMDVSLKACSFRDAACPSHVIPSTFDPSTSSGLPGFSTAANGELRRTARGEALAKGSEADLVFRRRHEHILDRRLQYRQEKARAKAEAGANGSPKARKKRQRESLDGPGDKTDPSSSSTSHKVQKCGQEDVHGSDQAPPSPDAPKTGNSLDDQSNRRVQNLKQLRFRSSGSICQYRMFYKSSILGTPAANVVPGSTPSRSPSPERSLRERHRYIRLYGSQNVFLAEVKRNSSEMEKEESETPRTQTFADGFWALLQRSESETSRTSSWVPTTSWSQGPARS